MAVAFANLEIMNSSLKAKKKYIKMGEYFQSSDEVEKRKALKSCFQTVEVARNQLNKDLILQLKKKYPVALEAYEALSLEFLKIPLNEEIDLLFLSKHLKKCYVVIKQMIQESRENEYQNSLKRAKSHISQLIELLEQTAILMEGKGSSKKGYPCLPDKLKIDSSKSRRQNRDCLFVKEYKNTLKKTEDILKLYR